MAIALAVAPTVRAGPTPVDVLTLLPKMTYDDLIKDDAYRDWGNEPSVAVNPLKPEQIMVTGFAPPFPASGLGGGVIWYSSDGGKSWTFRNPISQIPDVPNPPELAARFAPTDQVWGYDSGGNLHTAMMSTYGGLFDSDANSLGRYIFHGQTPDPTKEGSVDGSPWQWTNAQKPVHPLDQKFVDQPWMAISGKKVYIAYQDYGTGNDAAMVQPRIVRSDDGGKTFPAANDAAITSGGKFATLTNLGLRIATDDVGRVYSLFGTAAENARGNRQPIVQYFLNRSSDGVKWDFTTADTPMGLSITTSVSRQGQGTSFGGRNALRGNITAIAVDRKGTHIYAAYGIGANVPRMYLQEFHPDPRDPKKLVASDPVVLNNDVLEPAALPAVAVTDNGTVFAMYYTTTGEGKYKVYLSTSSDSGKSFSSSTLSQFDASDFKTGTDAFPSPDRILGDYVTMVAHRNYTFGTFAARGLDANGFDNTNKIDPFFFKAPAVADKPKPAPPAPPAKNPGKTPGGMMHYDGGPESGQFSGLVLANTGTIHDPVLGAQLLVPRVDFNGAYASGEWLFDSAPDQFFTIAGASGVFARAHMPSLTFDPSRDLFYGELDDPKFAGADPSSPFFDPALNGPPSQWIESLMTALGDTAGGNDPRLYFSFTPLSDVLGSTQNFSVSGDTLGTADVFVALPNVATPAPSAAWGGLALVGGFALIQYFRGRLARCRA